MATDSYAPVVDPNDQSRTQSPLQAAFGPELSQTGGGLTPKAYTPDEAKGLGLNWVDPANPNYGKAGFVGSESGAPTAVQAPGLVPAPGMPPAAAPTSPQPTSPKPGPDWVAVNGGWVPPNHPLAQTMAQPLPGAAPGVPGTPGTPTPGTAANADTLLNKFLTQGETTDFTSPEFRAQADPFAAAVERQKRSYLSQEAERASAEGREFGDVERRLADEGAGQQIGQFEANLATKNIEAKRTQTMQALQLAMQQGDSEKARALQLQLAQLDAAVRRESTQASTTLGQGDLDLRRLLGTRGLDLDAARLLFSNQQFGDDLGFRIGSKQADLNQNALQTAFGGGY